VQLKVQIVRYVDDYFPGIVECELVDAGGYLHTFVEKGPLVSDEWPGPEDCYPINGFFRCEILDARHGPDGRDLLRVTTQRPDYVETKEGVTEFVVLSSQVVSAGDTIAELDRKASAYEEEAKLVPERADLLLRQAADCRERIVALGTGHWPSRRVFTP
jgi:hypothetical protein